MEVTECVSGSASQEHINSFVRPALADMKDEELFQYVYVSRNLSSSWSGLGADSASHHQDHLVDSCSLAPSTQINLQENPLKSFLVTMFLSSLRKTVPLAQQPTYLLSHQSLEYLRESMGMLNKHVGYVFLVDWERRIRWAGCSWATLAEEEALRKCSHVLLERLKKGGGK
jgi:ATPase complex subunit ATP10